MKEEEMRLQLRIIRAAIQKALDEEPLHSAPPNAIIAEFIKGSIDGLLVLGKSYDEILATFAKAVDITKQFNK